VLSKEQWGTKGWAVGVDMYERVAVSIEVKVYVSFISHVEKGGTSSAIGGKIE